MNLNSQKVLSAIQATARRNEALDGYRNCELHGAQRSILSEVRRQRSASLDAMVEREVEQEAEQTIGTVIDQAQLSVTRLLLTHFEAHPEDVAPLATECDQPTSNAGTRAIHLAFATFLAPVLQSVVTRAVSDVESPASSELKAARKLPRHNVLETGLVRRSVKETRRMRSSPKRHHVIPRHLAPRTPK